MGQSIEELLEDRIVIGNMHIHFHTVLGAKYILKLKEIEEKNQVQ